MHTPDADSVLKNLDPDNQHAIIHHLKNGSVSQTILYLEKQFGIHTTPDALSRFFAWWHVSTPLDQLNQVIIAFKELEPDPALLKIKLDYLCQIALSRFMQKALEAEDISLLKTVCAIRTNMQLADLKVARFIEDQQRYRHKLRQEAEDRRATAELYAQEQEKEDAETQAFMAANPPLPPHPTILPDPPAPTQSSSSSSPSSTASPPPATEHVSNATPHSTQKQAPAATPNKSSAHSSSPSTASSRPTSPASSAAATGPIASTQRNSAASEGPNPQN